MQWDDLRVLLAVARHGLIAKAAAELNANPTTISRRIQRLESDIGQTLIERHSDGPRLTAAGRQIARQAAAMEAASQVIDQSHQPSLLRVSVSEGFGTWFMARHLADFARSHPAVEVELVATSGFLNPSRRETDIAILLAKPRRGPLATRKLTDYALQLFASRDLVGDDSRITGLAELRRERLIGYIPDLIYAPELDYLDEVGSGLNATMRSSSINAQHRFIAAGAGIGVLPCFIGNSDPSLVAVLPDIVINRSFWLSIHLDVRQRPHVRVFADWLTETIKANRTQFERAGGSFASRGATS